MAEKKARVVIVTLRAESEGTDLDIDQALRARLSEFYPLDDEVVEPRILSIAVRKTSFGDTPEQRMADARQAGRDHEVDVAADSILERADGDITDEQLDTALSELAPPEQRIAEFFTDPNAPRLSHDEMVEVYGQELASAFEEIVETYES